MWFRILGPVSLWLQGEPVSVGGPKPRAVLATLLLSQGRPVSRERLIDLVWGDEPPDSASEVIRQYVSTLRRALRRCGREDALVTHPGGYALRVRPDELDLTVFQSLAARGREAAQTRRWGQAAADYRQALALWQGRALDGSSLAGGSLARHVEEQHATVLDERIEADLALGEHAALVPELSRLLDENPLNERLCGRLMIALYRQGRQADALAGYRQARTLLGSELGVEPGPELRAIRDAILRGDESAGDQIMPALSAARRPTAGGTCGAASETAVRVTTPPRSTQVIPCQLPADIADFTGFEQQTIQLVDQLREPGRSTAVPVVVVSGPGGVGKTTLAVHVAHRLRPHFPDGQLYVNLRGGTAHPAPTGEVLGRFLLALGVPASAVPRDPEQRAEQFRTAVADRRMLLVLDDAACAAQVRTLLPGEARCAVIVTCRARLDDLEGAVRIDLDVLDQEQALVLLGRIAGSARISAAPDAAIRIVQLCGGLPLAVRIAGARLAGRPDRSIAWLADRLGHEHERLNLLSAGDLEVRASLATGYQGLPEPGRRAFRVLAHLDSEFAGWVAGPLLEVTAAEAEAVVDHLVRARLLNIAGVDALGQPRHRFHDLVQLYGREIAEAIDPWWHRVAAVARLAETSLQLAHTAAMRLPYSATRLRYLNAPPMGDPVWIDRRQGDPAIWLSCEQPTLINVVELAARHDLDEVAGHLTEVLTATSFAIGNHFDGWRRTHDAALGAARRCRNRRLEARITAGLGLLCQEQCRYAEAAEHYLAALPLAIEVGDVREQANIEYTLGTLRREVGQYVPALNHLTRAGALFAQLHDTDTDTDSSPDAAAEAKARIRYHTAGIRLERGDVDGAVGLFQDVLDVFRATGYRRAEAITLRSLGLAHRARGELDLAGERCRQARELLSDLGDCLLAAYAAQALAKVRIRTGEPGAAESLLTEALRTCRDLHDQFGTALVHRTMGELYLATGRDDDAIDHLRHALNTWRALGLAQWSARTLRDLGTAQLRTSDTHATAHRTWTEAQCVFRHLDMREAGELTEWRAGAGCTCPIDHSSSIAASQLAIVTDLDYQEGRLNWPLSGV